MTTKPIPGWPGYHASDDGKIFSSRKRVHVSGFTWRIENGHALKELRPFDRKTVRGKSSPYLSVCLARDGRTRNLYVHELVMLAFVGPRPSADHEICHGPRGSTCNALDNLRYGTWLENSAERALCRGADWYRSRGLPPPDLTVIEAPRERAHAFDGLI